MKTHYKFLFAELGSLGTSFFAVISAYQEQVEWWLRILASVVAIGAGVASIYFAKKRHDGSTPKQPNDNQNSSS